MTFRLITEAEAEFEWNQAVDYYEKQESGTGLRFNGIVQEYLRKIVRSPERFRLVSSATRKATSRQFPYSIYYTIEPNGINVVSVFHGSRNPTELYRRFK